MKYFRNWQKRKMFQNCRMQMLNMHAGKNQMPRVALCGHLEGRYVFLPTFTIKPTNLQSCTFSGPGMCLLCALLFLYCSFCWDLLASSISPINLPALLLPEC